MYALVLVLIFLWACLPSLAAAKPDTLHVVQVKSVLQQGALAPPFLFPTGEGQRLDRTGVHRYIWRLLLKKTGFRHIHNRIRR